MRKGQRLILYWDIFRDYVLSGAVPKIPVSYIPQAAIKRYYDALLILVNHKETTVADLALRLEIGKGAAENIVRDLIMVGNAERKGEVLRIIQQNEIEALEKATEFLRSHIVYQSLIEEKGIGLSVTLREFEQKVRQLYQSSDFSEITYTMYAERLSKWFTGLGVLIPQGNLLKHSAESLPRYNPSMVLKAHRPRERGRIFLGDAPPSRVIEVIESIKSGVSSNEELIRKGYRNALGVLISLNAVIKENDNWVLVTEVNSPIEKWVASKVLDCCTMKVAQEAVEIDSNISSLDLGRKISEAIGKAWTPSSYRRNGGSLLKWYKWCKAKDNR